MSSPRPPSIGGRSPRATRAVVVIAWALAAVLASAVVWWAVAVIGGARAGVVTQAEAAAELADRRAAAAGATPAPSSVPTPEPSSAAPSDVPTATATTAPAEPAEVARAWDVAGGQVGASCRGAQIALLYATPQDGWTVEVKHAGPGEVEVEFRRGESETKVRAECTGGTPAERIESGDG